MFGSNLETFLGWHVELFFLGCLIRECFEAGENVTFIPGEPTISGFYKSFIEKVSPHHRILVQLLIHIGAMLGNRPPNKNPWHAPGTAPISSPCGRFGGNPHGCRGGPPIEK